RGGKGPPRSGVGGSGEPISDCCPLPPASASSGGRNLPPLRGGQSLPTPLSPGALSPGALSPGAKRGGKGPPRSGVGGSGKPISDCCPLPPASASSGGRNLPPLRGGQSLPTPLSPGALSPGALSPGAKRGGKGPPRSGVGGSGKPI